MYSKFLKRIFDFFVSLIALVILFPILAVLSVIGAIVMKGNPFFTQKRAGKDEKIFKLIKFRTMTCAKDADGNLLPDAERLTRYGKLLRSTSVDELPELLNILKGDMSFVGPRPLVVQYLPYYNEQEKRRHSVRPGLTGLAQVNGRNNVIWEERFAYDVKYVDNITLFNDISILFKTVSVAFGRKDITVRKSDGSMDFDKYRQRQLEEESK